MNSGKIKLTVFAAFGLVIAAASSQSADKHKGSSEDHKVAPARAEAPGKLQAHGLGAGSHKPDLLGGASSKQLDPRGVLFGGGSKQSDPPGKLFGGGGRGGEGDRPIDPRIGQAIGGILSGILGGMR